MNFKKPYFNAYWILKYVNFWRHYDVLETSSNAFPVRFLKDLSFIFPMLGRSTLYLKPLLRYMTLKMDHFGEKEVRSISPYTHIYLISSIVVTLFDKNTLFLRNFKLLLLAHFLTNQLENFGESFCTYKDTT